MDIKNTKTNIALIGMAGAGKSTVGRELARLLGLSFMDVDTLIEADQNLSLQQLLNDVGVLGFRKIEERILLSLCCTNHIIATGGSVVYSPAGIAHLKEISTLVLLDVSVEVLKQRVGDFSARALIKKDNQSFEEVFAERQPLYVKYADYIVDCNNQSVSDICASIMARV